MIAFSLPVVFFSDLTQTGSSSPFDNTVVALPMENPMEDKTLVPEELSNQFAQEDEKDKELIVITWNIWFEESVQFVERMTAIARFACVEK